MTTVNWKAEAEKAKADGYVSGHWEILLRQSIERKNPALVKELGSDFQAYLIVQTSRAVDLYSNLIDEGTDPQTARELAMSELLESGDPVSPAQAETSMAND